MPFRKTNRRPGARTRLAVGAGLAAALLAITVTAWILHRTPTPERAAVQDASGRTTACFASDEAAYLASPDAAGAWTALQTQGAARGMNVQRLVVPVDGDQQAAAYLAGLISRHCDLILTFGEKFDRAASNTPKENGEMLLRSASGVSGKDFGNDLPGILDSLRRAAK